MGSLPILPVAREARVEDVPSIAEVNAFAQRMHFEQHPEVFKAPDVDSSEGYFRQQIEREDAHVLVIDDSQGVVVGYAVATVRDKLENPFTKARRILEFEQLAVAENAQGRGYGTSLIRAINKLAESLGADEIRLTVWLFNDRAIRVYEHMGFSRVRLEMVRRPKP